jgi:cytochrome c-type biogenesis protein
MKEQNFMWLYMNWNEKSKGTVTLKKICGVLVLLDGVYLIYRT